ncbi:MAG: hypothetical protein GDA43_00945 [Hormoscilla sp. SP5CHS1]|nr:hypothetical protein [Hormoscilla sp. SP12CHS1]MBC6451929.1 hypothetical protein [Hormoscilla sp. SP5CHS1]MBC6476132.1 hypothetical protein [Hormoscilla sp. GM102CHS1]
MGERVIADLTVEELKALIAEVVDDRMMRYWRQPEPVIDKVALKKLMDSIDSHRWTPPPGSPTLSQMIIEERAQWRQPM